MRFWATRDDLADRSVHLWRTEPTKINGMWHQGEWLGKLSACEFVQLFGTPVSPGEKIAVTLEKVAVERRT